VSLSESSSASATQAAQTTIAQGSKSFAVAARLFAPRMRSDAVLLYAWCRHCDDVIDGQVLGFAADPAGLGPASDRLASLRAETTRALEGRATDPVFAAFGEVMHRNGIPERLAFDHLDGFAMDVAGRRYETLHDTLAYCYGVAGVVGLMMARIMGVRDEATLQRACDLGLAFQLTNIARDIVDDAEVGRIYLPEDWLVAAGIDREAIAEPKNRDALAGVARRLVAAAEPYYASAAIGIRALPFRAAWAIATARGVYRAIGTEVVRRGPMAWNGRVSTSGAAKIAHVAMGATIAAAAGMSRGSAPNRQRGLWTHPAGIA
jgi:phytoene synthase